MYRSETLDRIERRIERAARLDTADTAPALDEYGTPTILLERTETDGAMHAPSDRALLAQADRIVADAQLRRAYNESEGWRALGRARQASARRARVQRRGADPAAVARRARSGALDPPTVRRSTFDGDGYLAGLRTKSKRRRPTTDRAPVIRRTATGYPPCPGVGCDGSCGPPWQPSR